MAPAPDRSAENFVELVPDPQPVGLPTLPDQNQSTRLMLTTAAHFVQQHLHEQLSALGLTPPGLSVLSGLAELSEASVPEIAAQCLVSEAMAEDAVRELSESGFVHAPAGRHSLTSAGTTALAAARDLEDALFAEKSTTLRLELSALIRRLQDGGLLPER